MSHLFRDQAVALMARERLHEIRDQLRAKKLAVGARFSAIEARVLWLAERACAVTNAAPPIPPERFPRVFHIRPDETASKFFTMGALGTSIPGFGSLGAADQDWVQRVLRKGTRDERRERVDANSARFALEVWRRARTAIGTSGLSAAAKDAALAAARAFYLGHLCHISANVVGGPIEDEMTWHLPGPPLEPHGGITPGTDVKLARSDVELRIEQLIKTRVLQPSVPGVVDWPSWLPTHTEVPQQLYQAFSDAFRDLYLTGDAHKGFADLEAAFSAGAPAVTPNWLQTAFAALRTSIAGAAAPIPGPTPAQAPPSTEWGFWAWVATMVPMIVPSLITIPSMAALDKGKNVGVDGNEKAWWQIFALQYGGTGLILPIYVLIASLASPRGFVQESWLGLVLGLIVLGFSIAVLARIDKEDEDDPGARWTLLAIPVVLELLYSIVYIGIVRGGGNRFNRLFAVIFALHIFLTLVNCAYLAIDAVANGLRDGGGDAFGWWCLYALVIAPIFGLGLPALLLRLTNPSPRAVTSIQFEQAPRFARLFDDSTLVSDPAVATPTLAQHFFPAGDADTGTRRRRKLMTIKWQNGTNDLYLRSRGDRIELKWVASGADAPAGTAAADQTVVLPQAPSSVRVFAGMLGLIRQPAAGPGAVAVTVEVPENEDHLLPEGLVLAAGFEDDLTRAAAARRTAADAWRKVVTDGVAIYHATKARLAVQFGKRGDATAPDEPSGVESNATGQIRRGATDDTVVGAGTRFVKEVAAGDLIKVGSNRAVVDEVIDDTHLRLSSAATWLPASAATGTAFARVSDDRRFDRGGAGKVRTHAAGGGGPALTVSAPPIVIGDDETRFEALFMTGDVIRVPTAHGNQDRRVVKVRSAHVLELDAPYSTTIDADGGSPYLRLGRHSTDGTPYFASPANDLHSGTSALDRAADLAALLCLGGVSHVMTDAERQSHAGAVTRFPGPRIARVYQCFRNWNLDRRRVNEWKMLVAGGAVSEKRGRPLAEPESTMIRPPAADGWAPVNADGEEIANQLGWAETLRRWMDVARRNGGDVLSDASLRPGDPSNVQLSRGLAYLLDLPNPRP